MKPLQPLDNNESFDALIRQALDKVEVDASLADKYWPGSQPPPPPEKKVPIGKWVIWFSGFLLLLVVALLWRRPFQQSRSTEIVATIQKGAATRSKSVPQMNQPLSVRPVEKPLPGDSSGTKNLSVHAKPLAPESHTPENKLIHSADLQSRFPVEKKELLPLSAINDSLPLATTPPQLKVVTTALPAIEIKKTDTASRKVPYIIW